MITRRPTIGIIGLGYVGYPLAFHFSSHFKVIGYDPDKSKIAALIKKRKGTENNLTLSSEPDVLKEADIYFIAVPTPVDTSKRPDLSHLEESCKITGAHLSPGNIVVIESTVFPGVTENFCVPLIEAASKLKWKKHFSVAYSPERINPGDELHSLTSVTKIVAADNPETLEYIAGLYERIVKAGIYRAPSIKIAEAAKSIENAQRDLNIAFMNELALIFNRIGVDTQEVLAAAGTKWNFLPFRPGLVGGHCIGVDPYYLTHCAEMAGYNPQVILAGRRINDGMGKYVAEQTVKQMIARGQQIPGGRVNILGFAFKEDCDDVRNTRVADIVAELRSYGLDIRVHDPVADADAVAREYGVELCAWDDLPPAQALVLAVPHKQLRNMDFSLMAEKLLPGGCIADVKAVLDRDIVAQAGFTLWRL